MRNSAGVFVLLALCGFTCLSFGIFQLVLSYLSAPIGLEEKTELNNDGTLILLPDIELCFPLHFKRKRLRGFGASSNLEKAFDYALGFDNFQDVVVSKTKLEFFSVLVASNSSNFQSLLHKLTSSCGDLIKTCWSGVQHTEFPCCNKNLKEDVLFPDRCFRISSSKMEVNSSNIFANSMLVGIEFPDSKDQFFFTPNTFSTRDAYLNIQGETRLIFSPGSWYTVTLKMRRDDSLYNPGSDQPCSPSLDPDTYDQRKCVWSCEAGKAEFQNPCPCHPANRVQKQYRAAKPTFTPTKSIMDMHNSSEQQKPVAELRRGDNRRICDPWELKACSEREPTQENRTESSDPFDCNSVCPTPCTRKSFLVDWVSAKIDITAWLQNRAFSFGLTVKEAKNRFTAKNTAFLDIRLNQDNISVKKEFYSFNFMSFVSNLASLLGLYVAFLCAAALCLFRASPRSKNLHSHNDNDILSSLDEHL